MPQHPLTIEIRPDESRITLLLAGELDLASCGTLRACFDQLAGDFDEVVVDLEQLRFLDSTGLSLLVQTQHDLRDRGGSLHLRSPQGHVRKVLEVSGVDQVLPILPTVSA